VRVLINRTDAIGDNILSMPILYKIKKFFPEAQIYVLIHPRCVDLYLNHPCVTEIISYDRKASVFTRFWQLLQIMKRLKLTHYFFLGGCRLPNWVAWLRRVPFRGGLISKTTSFLLLNQGVRQKRSIVAMHESEYNLELLAPLGMEFHHQELQEFAPQIYLTSEEKLQFREDFAHFLVSEGKETSAEMVFIHPGMTGHTLNWSSRNYGRLIARMERNFPGRFLFVISFTPSDEPYLKGLRDQLQYSPEGIPFERVVFFNGALKGLRHYMSVLSEAHLFIGPSTGTTHLANILGVKAIALYSPIKVQSAMRWGPFHRQPHQLKLLVPDVVCGESFTCAGNSCPYYECMAKIEVEDVIKQIPSLLESV